MQDSLHGKNITCPKCKASFAALTEEERQREEEERQKEKERLIEQMDADLERMERAEGEAQRRHAQEEEMANREQEASAEEENERIGKAKVPRLKVLAEGSRAVLKIDRCPVCGSKDIVRYDLWKKKQTTRVAGFGWLPASIAAGSAGIAGGLGCLVLCQSLFCGLTFSDKSKAPNLKQIPSTKLQIRNEDGNLF
jgi:ssDNA-binding Zn-finger/Zn-ribbon topoisomerase 1